jgi:predicted nucleic acid-binding protein
MKFYVDTCVWLDYLQERKGFNDEDLGGFASVFFKEVILKKHFIVVSKHLVYELSKFYNEVIDLFKILEKLKILIVVDVLREDILFAKNLSLERNVSCADSLHAILANKENAVLVTQNIKDFIKFKDFLIFKKPQNVFT